MQQNISNVPQYQSLCKCIALTQVATTFQLKKPNVKNSQTNCNRSLFHLHSLGIQNIYLSVNIHNINSCFIDC